MKLTFSTKAWDNYLYWQNTDKKMLKLDVQVFKLSAA